MISENERTQNAVRCLRESNLPGFGQLLYESHESLRSDYEVSCEELDYLANQTKEVGGCLGARMVGAGFGGCLIAVVQKSRTQDFSTLVRQQYRKQFGSEPEIMNVKISDGVQVSRM